MAAPYQNVYYPTYKIKKEGIIYNRKNYIIVTESYCPKYSILKGDHRLDKKGIYKYLDFYDGGCDCVGAIYKLNSLTDIKLIHRGNIETYFYPIDEYQIKPVRED